MRLFALTVLALSEGQKLLTAARQEKSKMPFPRELKDNAGICGRIQLRSDQPYGIQRPHKNKNGVPEITRKFLRTNGCTDEDMDSLSKEAKKVGIVLVKCRFPRPANHDEHRDVMYLRCMKNNPLARKSAKHEKIRKKAMKLKCHDGKLNLERMMRKCERWWDQELQAGVNSQS